MIGKVPAQMASKAENVTIWLRHHEEDKKARDTACIAHKYVRGFAQCFAHLLCFIFVYFEL